MFLSIVEAVISHSKTQPEKFCLADDNSSVTYKEYADKILTYANYFAELGIHSGDKVVVESCQSIEYLAIELALQLIGAVFVPTEHNCAADKIIYFSNLSDAKAVITQKEIVIDKHLTMTYDYIELHSKNVTKLNPKNLPKSDDISEILFSTGTTGKEKGIVLTHKNDIALAQNVMYGVEMDKDTIEMIPSPLNHSHGLRRYYANMYNGSSVVILGSVMNVLKFFKNLDEYKVNAIDMVPSALTVVLRLSKDKFKEYINQIKYIQYGAAPLVEQDKEKICSLLPKTRMYNFYGSTESGCTCIYNFNQPSPKKNCIGKPTYNTTQLIVDDDRNEIISSKDSTGYLATKGDMNMLEYWNDPDETNSVLVEGIVYSNDIGYIDEDGEIILLGRKGDVINVGGNKVSPDEIENVAKEMDQIADCGCIGVSDPSKGSVPKLFVQMAAGAVFDQIEIRKFLSTKLEPYKIPVIIEQIDSIPRSYNGKLLRRELK